MEAYRDQYASVFRNGRGVTILAISNDSPEALASWAADDDFPVLFGSDPEGSAAQAFGVGARGNGMASSRAVVIVDPEGRVSFATPQFREVDPTSYEELAAEVANAGITANAICPGYVDTPMTDFSVANIVDKTGVSPEEARARILSLSPQKRLIRPEEIAHVALMLCGDDGEGINGDAIVLDGGR